MVLFYKEIKKGNRIMNKENKNSKSKIAAGKPIPWVILISIFYAGQIATVISLKKKALNVSIR